LIDIVAEVAAFMGSDVNAKSLINVFSVRFRPLSRDQTALRNAGQDPLLLDIEAVEGKKSGIDAEVSNLFLITVFFFSFGACSPSTHD